MISYGLGGGGGLECMGWRLKEEGTIYAAMGKWSSILGADLLV